MKKFNYELMIIIASLFVFWFILGVKVFSKDISIVYRGEICNRYHFDDDTGLYNNEPSSLEIGLNVDKDYYMLGEATNSFGDETYSVSYMRRNPINKLFSYTLGVGLNKGYKREYHIKKKNKTYKISYECMITDDIGFEAYAGIGIEVMEDVFIDVTLFGTAIITTITMNIF